MEKSVLWAIYREEPHSPGRQSDDRLIIDAVTSRLDAMDVFDVQAFHPRELPADPDPLPDLIFYMCESREILPRLASWEARGVELVNPLQGVLNTYRTKTVGLLRTEPFFPTTRFARTDEPLPFRVNAELPSRVWVKRGDYHAVCPDDVLQADSDEALASAFERFRERGIAQVVVQDHVEGDLLKFYGVRNHAAGSMRWFTWFYHANRARHGHPVNEARLRRICEAGARRLGLEIFGGDVIATESGELHAIDFNAWPSFALYRETASEHIARHIAERSVARRHVSHPEVSAR